MPATTQFVNSEAIYVFPSTRRVSRQLTARLMSETSITGLLNHFVDTDGYVITPFTYDDEESPYLKPFEFNIYGYYFKVQNANYILQQFPNATQIYAYIQLDKTGNYYELMGQDADVNSVSVYQGVKFIDQNPSTAGVVYDKMLLLFERENSSASWYVPEWSTIRFISGFAFDIKEIDGGVV